MQIKGTFKQTIFSSNNGYVIGLFKIKESDDLTDYVNKLITITGYFDNILENENYILIGETVNHPKYGFQFNVSSYEKIRPEDKDGIIEFLASDLFKGVGEKLATRIVETLGKNTLDLILEDKENLMKVYKMTEKKANLIYDTLNNYSESHKIIVNLTELGFSSRDALLIYNMYKNNTMNVIEHNIYKIADDIKGIGFKKVDTIAIQKNINPLNDNRLYALILYIMQTLTYQNGDTYLDYEEIKFRVSEYLDFDIDDKTLKILFSNLSSNMKIFILDDKYYLYDIYEAEYNIVTKIKYLVSKKKDNYKKLDKLIKKYEEKFAITYNEEQKNAIKTALNNNITIITGGPGVGKTTIIKSIVEIYKDLNLYNDFQLDNKLALLAPTGRASKRICESTSYKATTIHRFLKWNKENDSFSINEYNKDYSHLVIVDEASMIDINLLNNLFLGLTNNIKLVLVGDYNQLPSVGPGEVLKDLIESKIIDTVYLNHLYRQTNDSYIPILSKEIKENNLTDYLKRYDDYMFIEADNYNMIKVLKDVCSKLMTKGYNYSNTQIMAPMYASKVGIDNLNKILQDVFNAQDGTKAEIKYGDQIFRINDKVLQLKNEPDLNVFNGDVGIIVDITKDKEIIIDFDSNVVHYQVADLVNIKHGYVISIHKSQGSEFKLVIMLVANNYKRLLYRKLIYTGVTRAKNKLIIIGENEAFLAGVHNKNEYIRKTLLKEKLLESINK